MATNLKDLYTRGTELFEKGLYSEAELFLRKVLQISRNYADVNNKLGVIAKLKGFDEDAIEHFKHALKINPNYTEAALNLAITYSDLGESERAQEALANVPTQKKGETPRMDPFVAGKMANEHFKLGNIYFDFHMHDEAIEQFEKALKLKPGLADICTRLGVAYRENGNMAKSIEHLIGAKEANPYFGPALVQLGLSYFIDGKRDMARKEWENALVSNPDMKEAQTFLALLKDKD